MKQQQQGKTEPKQLKKKKKKRLEKALGGRLVGRGLSQGQVLGSGPAQLEKALGGVWWEAGLMLSANGGDLEGRGSCLGPQQTHWDLNGRGKC